MNKISKMLLVMACMIGITTVGCNVTPEQMKVIAQNAGLGAAVTWIAYDNPSQAEKDCVIGVMDVIKNNATNVIAGATYTEVLYPEVEKYVHNGKVPPQYIPITLAGSYAVLSGIDTLFAFHPEYKKNETLALSVVTSFTDGAKQGLRLTSSDKAIIQAKKMNTTRAKIYKNPRGMRFQGQAMRPQGMHGHHGTNIVVNVTAPVK